jgi:hypothetical protein
MKFVVLFNWQSCISEAPCVKSRSQNWDPKSCVNHPPWRATDRALSAGSGVPGQSPAVGGAGPELRQAWCLMHRWNKNPTLSQNHNLPTDPPTYRISYLPMCFFFYLLDSCTYFLIFCFLTIHLTYLLTISLKNHLWKVKSLLSLLTPDGHCSQSLLKTTFGKWTVCSLLWLRTDTVANHYSPCEPRAVHPESGEGTSFLYII